ncbi:MAG TPA: isochorismatase family protein [Candidatus Binatia bacterium]|nr:isochorismatase family protein [Candidatus Binatia bacterium]
MPLLDRAQTLLLVIDVQERYLPHLYEGERVVEGTRRLIEAAKIVGVPIATTEQYPRGIGPTAPALRAALPAGHEPIQKLSLSCLGARQFAERLEASGRRQVLVAGIEAHACVNHTVHDLLAAGYGVHLAVDAVSSRFRRDYEIGVARLARAGAVATTVEAALLEWVRTAESPEFQPVRALIRDPLPGDGEPPRV